MSKYTRSQTMDGELVYTLTHEEIINETLPEIIDIAIDFAKMAITTHLNNPEFVLNDCRNSILDMIKNKKEQVKSNVDSLKKILESTEQNVISVHRKDLEKLIEYIED